MSREVEVPLVDLGPGDEWPDIMRGVSRAAHSGQFLDGPYVQGFEDRWAERTGADECALAGSGTAALTGILRALAYGTRGKRRYVVIPATSFVATREAVENAGLRPLYTDVNDRGLMGVGQLVQAIRKADPSKILAVVPVHLYGQVADVPRLKEVAAGFGIPSLVEDACQAHGAAYADGSPVGSAGNLCAWSFMPAKILGAWGDCGAVTGPGGLVDGVRMALNHGRTAHAEHDFPGDNGRADEVQAAVLAAKLGHMDGAIRRREKLATEYREALEDTPLRTQGDQPGRVWSYFACWARDRDERDDLRAFLRDRGIATGVHYPYALPDAFASDRPPVGPYPAPNARDLASRTLTLPLWPGLSTDDRRWVAAKVRDFYRRRT